MQVVHEAGKAIAVRRAGPALAQARVPPFAGGRPASQVGAGVLPGAACVLIRCPAGASAVPPELPVRVHAHAARAVRARAGPRLTGPV